MSTAGEALALTATEDLVGLERSLHLDEARAIYGGFDVETADLSYSLAGGDQRRAAREMIVSG